MKLSIFALMAVGALAVPLVERQVPSGAPPLPTGGFPGFPSGLPTGGFSGIPFPTGPRPTGGWPCKLFHSALEHG
ncbi:hypothetical protein IQ07DRAFT_591301 [Pyrenochaeta sp. DS3sAY3a]|nr:hypothetical protein IQ07DRAFT_591301 [Pyrenochaeta sp. DS3sAY3a]